MPAIQYPRRSPEGRIILEGDLIDLLPDTARAIRNNGDQEAIVATLLADLASYGPYLGYRVWYSMLLYRQLYLAIGGGRQEILRDQKARLDNLYDILESSRRPETIVKNLALIQVQEARIRRSELYGTGIPLTGPIVKELVESTASLLGLGAGPAPEQTGFLDLLGVVGDVSRIAKGYLLANIAKAFFKPATGIEALDAAAATRVFSGGAVASFVGAKAITTALLIERAATLTSDPIYVNRVRTAVAGEQALRQAGFINQANTVARTLYGESKPPPGSTFSSFASGQIPFQQGFAGYYIDPRGQIASDLAFQIAEFSSTSARGALTAGLASLSLPALGTAFLMIGIVNLFETTYQRSINTVSNQYAAAALGFPFPERPSDIIVPGDPQMTEYNRMMVFDNAMLGAVLLAGGPVARIAEEREAAQEDRFPSYFVAGTERTERGYRRYFDSPLVILFKPTIDFFKTVFGVDKIDPATIPASRPEHVMALRSGAPRTPEGLGSQPFEILFERKYFGEIDVLSERRSLEAREFIYNRYQRFRPDLPSSPNARVDIEFTDFAPNRRDIQPSTINYSFTPGKIISVSLPGFDPASVTPSGVPSERARLVIERELPTITVTGPISFLNTLIEKDPRVVITSTNIGGIGGGARLESFGTAEFVDPRGLRTFNPSIAPPPQRAPSPAGSPVFASMVFLTFIKTIRADVTRAIDELIQFKTLLRTITETSSEDPFNNEGLAPDPLIAFKEIMVVVTAPRLKPFIRTFSTAFISKTRTGREFSPVLNPTLSIQEYDNTMRNLDVLRRVFPYPDQRNRSLKRIERQLPYIDSERGRRDQRRLPYIA